MEPDFAQSLADLHKQFDQTKQQRLLYVVFDNVILKESQIVGFKLKPLFNNLLKLRPPGTRGGSPKPDAKSNGSGDLEQQQVHSAINSLFEFEFSTLEGLLPSVHERQQKSSMNSEDMRPS